MSVGNQVNIRERERVESSSSSMGSGIPKRTFAERLELADDENTQVNPIYSEYISKTLKSMKAGMDVDTASHTKRTDGLFDCYYINDNGHEEWFLLHLECKKDLDLNEPKSFAQVLLQVLYYIKLFDRDGMQIPKVIVLGTKLNCTAIPTIEVFDKYIKGRNYPTEDEKGKRIKPSDAYMNPLYKPLLNLIINDSQLQQKIRILTVKYKNTVKELCIDIIKIAKEIGIKENVEAQNLSRAFDIFDLQIISPKYQKKLTSRQKVEAFIHLIINPDKVSTNTVKNALGQEILSSQMNFNGIIIEVEPIRFNSFANSFAIKKYTLEEQKKITEIADRLIEDTDRRRKGDFYTPTIWVDAAHKMLSDNFGKDWRQKYIVWDCAWGTGNLTRDYNDFKALYCSTIEDNDLRVGAKYNPFATKFQYDFLEDDVDLFESVEYMLKEPLLNTILYTKGFKENIERFINFKDIDELYKNAINKNIITVEQAKEAYERALGLLYSSKLYDLAGGLIDRLLDIENEDARRLLFFINPPYGTSGEMSSAATGKKKKSDIAKTSVNSIMDEAGECKQQLYTQFIYRIHKLCKLFGISFNLGIFSPPLFMTGEQSEKLRPLCLDNKFKDGFIIQASTFQNVKNNWGISFTVWGDNGANDYRLKIYDDESKALSEDTNNIEYKRLIPASKRASKWAKESCTDYKEQYKIFTMSNALTVTDGILGMADNVFGWGMINQNIPESNGQYVMILNTRNKGHLSAFPLTKASIDTVLAYYTARKVIEPNWLNSKDEYNMPNVESDLYKQYVQDSIIYSVFNDSCNISSLRNIVWDQGMTNIYNNLFWMSRSEIYSIASGESDSDDQNEEILKDCIEHANSERFIYEKIQTLTLSNDAKEVLEKASDIVRLTFKYREEFNRKHSEYHINTWDAGWYQIKALAKEYMPNELKCFDELYKAFEVRMRDLVYELGFLYE